MSDTLHVETKDSVQTLTLNRPDKLNAFTAELLEALNKAVKAAEKDPEVRCLVLTGAGRAFSAGQDLADVAGRYKSDEPIELGSHLRKHYNPLVTRLRTMEKPVIAAVNGVAAGAGCSLALACDIRLAATSASFIQAFVHVGLVPDSGATFMMPRLIGPARAFEMAATGRKVRAEEAAATGLINRVVEDDDLLPEAAKLAAALSHLPPVAIGLTKRALNAAWTANLADHLDYEAMLQTTAGQTADHREGVTAFLEKRKPKWKGK